MAVSKSQRLGWSNEAKPDVVETDFTVRKDTQGGAQEGRIAAVPRTTSYDLTLSNDDWVL